MAGQSPAIPEALEDELLRRAGQLDPATKRRYTTRALAAWLATDHGVTVDHTAVARTLRRLRDARTKRLILAARDLLASQLAPALRRFARVERELASRIRATTKPGALVDLADAHRKAVETMLRFGGVGEKVTVEADITSGGKPLQVYVPAEIPVPVPPAVVLPDEDPT